MLMNPKTMTAVTTLILIVVPPACAWAQQPVPPDRRERERRIQEEKREAERRETLDRREAERISPERWPKDRGLRAGPPPNAGRPYGDEPGSIVEALRRLLEPVMQDRQRGTFLRGRRELDELRDELRHLEHQANQLHHAIGVAQRDGLTDEVERGQLDLDFLRGEIGARSARSERLAEHLRQGDEREHLEAMTHRLRFVSSFREITFDPRRAVTMATQAIVELDMARDEPGRAAETLEHLLASVDELGTRTAIRFALKDLYMEMGQPDRAREHMMEAVLENARGIPATRGVRGRGIRAPGGTGVAPRRGERPTPVRGGREEGTPLPLGRDERQGRR